MTLKIDITDTINESFLYFSLSTSPWMKETRLMIMLDNTILPTIIGRSLMKFFKEYF